MELLSYKSADSLGCLPSLLAYVFCLVTKISNLNTKLARYILLTESLLLDCYPANPHGNHKNMEVQLLFSDSEYLKADADVNDAA